MRPDVERVRTRRETLRNANLALRFLLELGAFAAVGYWGATIQAGVAPRSIVTVLAPSIVAIVWGMFISPKARIPTGVIGRSGLGFLVFSAAALVLWVRGHSTLAVTYWSLAAASSAILLVLPQPAPA